MSFLANGQKHFQLTEEQFEQLYEDVRKFVVYKKRDNKEVVLFIRNELKTKYGVIISQQQMYEKLSMFIGMKNYNVALSKKMMFWRFFMKGLGEHLFENFFSGKGISNLNEYGSNKIITGITEFDKDPMGGLFKGQVHSIVSGTNQGKSMFVQSIACNAMRTNKNLKVLHISLEGIEYIRYCSNITNELFSEVLGSLKLKLKIEQLAKFKKQLIIKKPTKFDYSIEELIESVKTLYNDFKFDLLIIDYPQLLSTKDKMEYNDSLNIVWQGLNKIAQECNCAVLVPVQASKNIFNAEPSLNCISSYIAMKSNLVLFLDKKVDNNIDLLVLKTRQPLKNNKYETKTDFARSNLILNKK